MRHQAEKMSEGADGAPIDSDRQGLARELARMNLMLNTDTRWYWKCDPRNFLHFLHLRADAHAEYEIRAYADVMIDTVKRWTPAAHPAFMDYRMGLAETSAQGMDVIRRLLAGEAVTADNSGMSPREWRELTALLGRDA